MGSRRIRFVWMPRHPVGIRGIERSYRIDWVCRVKRSPVFPRDE